MNLKIQIIKNLPSSLNSNSWGAHATPEHKPTLVMVADRLDDFGAETQAKESMMETVVEWKRKYGLNYWMALLLKHVVQIQKSGHGSLPRRKMSTRRFRRGDEFCLVSL